FLISAMNPIFNESQNPVCTICFEDIVEQPSTLLQRIFCLKAVSKISGLDHKKQCQFHSSCLNDWRFLTDKDEDPANPLSIQHPNLQICPNDRLQYSKINNVHILVHDLKPLLYF